MEAWVQSLRAGTGCTGQTKNNNHRVSCDSSPTNALIDSRSDSWPHVSRSKGSVGMTTSCCRLARHGHRCVGILPGVIHYE